MAEKRIPGIPHATRIGLLQQTDIQDEDEDDTLTTTTSTTSGTGSLGTEGGSGVDQTTQQLSSQKKDKNVLEQVMSSDRFRNELVRDINGERHDIRDESGDLEHGRV